VYRAKRRRRLSTRGKVPRVKTFLVWNIACPLSEQVCLELARRGHRLLCVGDSPDLLARLDLELSQAELHRFAGQLAARDLPDWVAQQKVGLDALVMFPTAPVVNLGLLALQTKLDEQLRTSLTAPLEVMRQLMPSLMRGKKPKPLLVVLGWQTLSRGPAAWDACLIDTWRTCIRRLARDNAEQGLCFNLFCPGKLVEGFSVLNAPAPDDPVVELPARTDLPGGPISARLAAQMAANLLDSVGPSLTGQSIELGLVEAAP
jgi:NAD(P)-dependent dehydrogenase (short-subunit alcohol dehydrogenase family)